MLTGASLRIVEKAIAIQIANGEDVEETVRHYSKLSEEQMTEIINKYKNKEGGDK